MTSGRSNGVGQGDTRRESVVVLGGTGAVGQAVALELHRLGHAVTIAGRDVRRAARVADKIDGAPAIAVALSDADPLSRAGPPGFVVDCTGVESADTTNRLLRAGWRVVDITADGRHTRSLLQLNPTNSTLLIGVGLMPGLSSILATRLHERDPAATSMTIAALIGLGDDYGEASKRWTYGQVGRPVPESNGIRGFTDSHVVDFPGGFGRRATWQVDFADRALLPPVLGIPVTTRYCFDSRLAGKALAVSARIPGLPALLASHPDLTRPPRHATDWYAFVAVTNTGARLTGIGRSQRNDTATMIALAVNRLAKTPKTGLLTTLDLLDLDDITANNHLNVLISD